MVCGKPCQGFIRGGGLEVYVMKMLLLEILPQIASEAIQKDLKIKNFKTFVCLCMLLQPYYHFFPTQQKIGYETLHVQFLPLS